ncbi:MAG: hypothetical protein M5U34_12755 [Chloroflexi bacterium]|nr:hypothetical protein [Chloroflexota bacterium]
MDSGQWAVDSYLTDNRSHSLFFDENGDHFIGVIVVVLGSVKLFVFAAAAGRRAATLEPAFWRQQRPFLPQI